MRLLGLWLGGGLLIGLSPVRFMGFSGRDRYTSRFQAIIMVNYFCTGFGV